MFENCFEKFVCVFVCKGRVKSVLTQTMLKCVKSRLWECMRPWRIRNVVRTLRKFVVC